MPAFEPWEVEANQQWQAEQEAKRAVFLAKAQTALATNSTFLALASPTNAQTLAQVKALTRETNALIRLLLGALDDVSDT